MVSTSRNYEQGRRALERFHAEFSIPMRLPLSRECMAGFIAWMCRPSATAPNGLAASTMKVYLSGVRDFCKRLGCPDPFDGDWFLERIFKAAKKAQARPVRRRVAMVQPILRLVLWALDSLHAPAVLKATSLCMVPFLRIAPPSW